ncbi:MAG TPA: S1-like domain-containing RNA-binding protein [Opitutaceae bacterium]|nr:S1-like domain-containing RNA-binding protein [Opitutaceae bacterium]
MIGKRCTLSVTRVATPGVFLDGGARGEILLPGRYVPQGTIPGESFDVFVHRDSEDRIVATTEVPKGVVGEFVALRVISANPAVGAFLDWGLSKDLFLPIREQSRRVNVGEMVVVYIFVDLKTDRIVATTRLNRHLNVVPPDYVEGQAVDLLVYGRTELGYNAIIASAHVGLLYHNELPGSLEIGQKIDGYVRAVRPDGKIDLAINPSGYGRVAPLKEQILEALAKRGGRLALSDASSPAEIRDAFGVSKKAFKQAIGALYRERLITIEPVGIRLAQAPSERR